VATTLLDDGQKRLVASLEEATKVLREVAKPAPPVVIINQLPPSSPTPAWHEVHEGAAIGGGLAVLVLVLVAAGCWWLSRYRPDKWEKVRSRAWRFITWLALPLSWMCGRAASFFHHLHSSAEGHVASSANTVQVSETEAFN